jgi:hypothetical protein
MKKEEANLLLCKEQPGYFSPGFLVVALRYNQTKAPIITENARTAAIIKPQKLKLCDISIFLSKTCTVFHRAV